MADALAGTVQNENIDKFLYMAVVISLRTPPVAVQAAERGPRGLTRSCGVRRTVH